jgi:L-iditol 2-dehydrogenase
MKAAQLTNIDKIDIINLDNPTIKTDKDVLIKVMRVGICGSDIHYYKTGKIGFQVVKYPFIVGHEMSGVVEEIGLGVTKVRVNDRVAIDPLIYCEICDQCTIGRFNTCRSQKFLGCPSQMEGCLKEYIVMPEKCCYPIPEEMSYETAVLCEPLSIGYYSTTFADSLKDKKIAILGAGSIGLSVLLISKAHKASKIYVTDLLDYRLKIAKKNGADWTGNPHNADSIKEIIKDEKYKMDYVFECCGMQEASELGLELLKPGGKFIIIGIPEFENYNFNAHIMRRNEITIQNIRRQNEYMDKTIKIVANKIVNPDFMITHHFPLSEAGKAFDIVSNYKDNVIKAIIDFD